MSQLADHWLECEIGDLGSVRSGGTPKTKVPEYWSDEDVAWITPADLSGYSAMYIQRGRKSISRAGLEASSAQVIPTGSVLFSSRAPVGYVVIASRELSTNQGFKSLVPTEGIIPEYMYYYFQSIRGLANERATGTTFKELSGKAFAKLPVRIAPTIEQRAIAAKIEALFNELDAGVSQLESAQALLKRYRQSVLKAAFEGRLTADWREQRRKEAEANGEKLPTAQDLLKQIEAERQERTEQQHAEWQEAVTAWEAAGGKDSGEKKPRKPAKPKDPPPLTEEELASLPELPEGWAWVRLTQVAEIGTGTTPSRSNESFWKTGTIPWIASAAVNQEFCDTASDFVTEAGQTAGRLTVYPSGTLLLAMYGEGKTRGKVTELRIEATVNQALAAIQVSNATLVLVTYIKRFLQRNYHLMRERSAGGVQPNLNVGLVSDFRVPLPLCDEAAVITEVIDSRLSVIADVQSTIDTALLHASSLRQSILKRAFEGRLLDETELEAVRSHPDYEPAEKLLERIRSQAEASKKTKKPTKKKTTRKKRSARKTQETT